MNGYRTIDRSTPRECPPEISARCWRVLLDEPLSLQLGPELRRNPRLHRGHVGEDLFFTPRPDDQSRGDVRDRGKLQRCGSKVCTVLGSHRTQLLPLLDVFTWDVPGILAVVVTRTARDEPRVQG